MFPFSIIKKYSLCKDSQFHSYSEIHASLTVIREASASYWWEQKLKLTARYQAKFRESSQMERGRILGDGGLKTPGEHAPLNQRGRSHRGSWRLK